MLEARPERRADAIGFLLSDDKALLLCEDDILMGVVYKSFRSTDLDFRPEGVRDGSGFLLRLRSLGPMEVLRFPGCCCWGRGSRDLLDDAAPYVEIEIRGTTELA